MQEDFLFGVSFVALANVVERVAQRLNRRFDRGLDFASLELEAVDFSLDVLEPQRRLLKEQIGPRFSLTNHAFGLLLGVVLDLVGQLLSGHQRVAQALFRFAVLVERGFHPGHFLTQTIRFAKGLFVVVGNGRQKRAALDFVEAHERFMETLLDKIEATDVHAQFCSAPSYRPMVPQSSEAPARLPKIAVPTRTRVAPSSTATSKSWLIPIDSSASIDRSTPRSSSRCRTAWSA